MLDRLFTIFFLVFTTQVWAQLDSKILINHGSRYANSYKAELKLKPPKKEGIKVSAMMLSNRPDFQGSHWTDFKDIVYEWPLEYKDGHQTVYAKFKYSDGSVSDLFEDQVIVDTTPPENPYIKIETPKKFVSANSYYVDLSVSAVDAKYVKISNYNNFYTHRWRIFKDNEILDWKLEEGDDGPRSVYVKFRDPAGNESEVVNDQIIIDRTAPFDGHLILNEGQQYLTVQSKKVHLEIFAREADSMLISQSESFNDVVWEAYSTEKYLTLEGEDGKKNIYIKFSDLAGNESGVLSGEVYLDITPPKNCSVQINGGSETTNQIDKLVTINVSAPDAQYMLISNSPTFQDGRWTAVENIVEDWQLDGENDGLRTVFVKFKDEAGNISSTFRASIMLDRGF